jgi:putative ABC transport system ATP-binding protein
VRPSLAAERSAEVLAQVGMAHRAKHLPSQLSGGEQQRVAVARALVIRPVLLLADDPTGNLDSAAGQNLTNLMRRLVDEQSQTIVMVTHDASVASHADRIIHLRDGVIERETCGAESGSRFPSWQGPGL